jgi:hypothetical protein
MMPMAAALLQLPVPSAPLISGPVSATPTEFGGEFASFLAAASAPAEQPATPAVAFNATSSGEQVVPDEASSTAPATPPVPVIPFPAAQYSEQPNVASDLVPMPTLAVPPEAIGAKDAREPLSPRRDAARRERAASPEAASDQLTAVPAICVATVLAEFAPPPAPVTVPRLSRGNDAADAKVALEATAASPLPKPAAKAAELVKPPVAGNVPPPPPPQHPVAAAETEPPSIQAPSFETLSSAVPAAAEPLAQAATRSATPAPVDPSSRAPSPVEQIAPALVRISHAPDGAQRLTLRLDPPELGHVQVRIDRSVDAPARVAIIVERADTLTLLLRDQPQLQRALDQAGVPADGRTITFHVATPDPVARSEPAIAPAPGVATGGASGDGSHGASRQDGQPARRQSADPDTGSGEFISIPPAGWLRGGLDITA